MKTKRKIEKILNKYIKYFKNIIGYFIARMYTIKIYKYIKKYSSKRINGNRITFHIARQLFDKKYFQNKVRKYENRIATIMRKKYKYECFRFRSITNHDCYIDVIYYQE